MSGLILVGVFQPKLQQRTPRLPGWVRPNAVREFILMQLQNSCQLASDVAQEDVVVAIKVPGILVAAAAQAQQQADGADGEGGVGDGGVQRRQQLPGQWVACLEVLKQHIVLPLRQHAWVILSVCAGHKEEVPCGIHLDNECHGGPAGVTPPNPRQI